MDEESKKPPVCTDCRHLKIIDMITSECTLLKKKMFTGFQSYVTECGLYEPKTKGEK